GSQGSFEALLIHAGNHLQRMPAGSIRLCRFGASTPNSARLDSATASKPNRFEHRLRVVQRHPQRFVGARIDIHVALAIAHNVVSYDAGLDRSEEHTSELQSRG